jgi:hypothetical protein
MGKEGKMGHSGVVFLCPLGRLETGISLQGALHLCSGFLPQVGAILEVSLQSSGHGSLLFLDWPQSHDLCHCGLTNDRIPFH